MLRSNLTGCFRAAYGKQFFYCSTSYQRQSKDRSGESPTFRGGIIYHKRCNNNHHKAKRRHCQDMMQLQAQAPVNSCVPTVLSCRSIDGMLAIGCFAATNQTVEYSHLLMAGTLLIPNHPLRHPHAHGHVMSSGFEWLVVAQKHTTHVPLGHPESPINRVQDISKHKTCNLYIYSRQ